MRVLFAGGGTGGHINPAISVADHIKSVDENFEALFIGTENGLEKKLVPAAGYNIEYIDICGFNRKQLYKNISVIKKLSDANKRVKEIIESFKPDAVLCTGGYVSGPVAMAAKKCGVGAVIHEQNVYPGLTVNGSEKYVDYVAVSFKETINHMGNKKKCVYTGNPVRGAILNADIDKAKDIIGMPKDKPLVLIFGGSLGAGKINETVLNMLGKIIKENRFYLIFATGDRNYEDFCMEMKKTGITTHNGVKILPYIDNMADVMAAADLVVSRSGAITVSEIAALGKASVLIPSPNVVRNHQEQNARELEKKNAAVVITEDELDGDMLYDKITELVIRDCITLGLMGYNAKKLAKRDALDEIYKLLLKVSEKNKSQPKQ
ncbi:MAG: undecaprenyldiphospho-muramoylpentapeptide beta-N-acetylglucosaminyltransferase [Oscillospiraceae bacterium]|nr:undecaprenyldiphospho-muramoylpentapeptide beta-N-acetylglucosaminyltransferase [Oscillospiraceae bacterium]